MLQDLPALPALDKKEKAEPVEPVEPADKKPKLSALENIPNLSGSCAKPDDDNCDFVNDFLGDVFFVSEEMPKESPKDIAKRELDRYMREIILPSTRPLTWWRNNANYFPLLSQLARKYLCTPATSVPSERVFSAAGLTVTKQRSSLSPDNVDKLIFLNKNYKLFN